ncbi:MAG: hypothetical protein NC902_08550, partial [Candidatus Omnitrophica bacterium]|nr:hypothetical protein [Candidatus Omnitrophota bacterium]
MSEKEFVYQMRLKIFWEADKKGTYINLMCKKYHVSRKRRDKEGDEGLSSKIRAKPKMPNRVSKEIEERILTDCGAEYTSWKKEAIQNHKFEMKRKKLGIKHTTTKV